MANNQDQQSREKVVYVGDSRVRKQTKVYLPRDYSAYPGKSEAFIPNFLLKEWMVAVVFLVGILVLVMSDPAPLGYPADPTKTDFLPIPDWYFLFLYQLLKYPYAADKFVLFGTVIVPGIAFGSLLLAPFLDSGKERRFYRRPMTSAIMFLSLIAVSYLTITSWNHYTQELEVQNIVPEHIKRAEELRAGIPQPKPAGNRSAAIPPIVMAEDEGFELYKRSTCLDCHGGELKGNLPAIPGLRGIGDKYSKDEIMGIIKDGKGGMSPQYEANITAKNLTDADINKIAEWLSLQKK